MLYTTITVTDFQDADYIRKLQELNIGIELALLTKLSDQLNENSYVSDLDNLKKETLHFVDYFQVFDIPLHEIRVHQPGGYTYNWSGFGFDLLKDFFMFCHNAGFEHFVIHTPYGNSATDESTELDVFRKKLDELATTVTCLEVEEIVASCKDLKNKSVRCYNGSLFERLMHNQKATALLDFHECGGVDATIRRLNYLRTRGFVIKSMHIHKDKHKCVTNEELGMLIGKSKFSGNIINEGFLKPESSFDQFLKTKSLDNVLSHSERIAILADYKRIIEQKKP